MDDLTDSEVPARNSPAGCISYLHVVVHAVCQGDGTSCSWLVWLPRLRSSDGRGRRSRTDSRSHDALVVLQLVSIPAYMLPKIEATMSSGHFASTFSAEFARAAWDPSLAPDSKVLSWYLYGANETSGPGGEGGGGGVEAKYVEDAVLAGLAIAVVCVLLTLGMSAAAGMRRDADTQVLLVCC
jgi:hypothetical protein